MRRLPLRVPVGSLWYKVKQVSRKDPVMRSRETPTFGFCDDDACVLFIARELSLQMKWATLIHEWVHAVGGQRKEFESNDLVDDMSDMILGLMKHLFEEMG